MIAGLILLALLVWLLTPSGYSDSSLDNAFADYVDDCIDETRPTPPPSELEP